MDLIQGNNYNINSNCNASGVPDNSIEHLDISDLNAFRTQTPTPNLAEDSIEFDCDQDDPETHDPQSNSIESSARFGVGV